MSFSIGAWLARAFRRVVENQNRRRRHRRGRRRVVRQIFREAGGGVGSRFEGQSTSVQAGSSFGGEFLDGAVDQGVLGIADHRLAQMTAPVEDQLRGLHRKTIAGRLHGVTLRLGFILKPTPLWGS